MLKLLPPEDNFHNFKCGEVFCITSSTFNVACCLCGIKLDFLKFPGHFLKHLLQVNNGDLEDVDKTKEKECDESDPIRNETDDDDDEELRLLQEVDEEETDDVDDDIAIAEVLKCKNEDEELVDLNQLQLRSLTRVPMTADAPTVAACSDDDMDWPNDDFSSTEDSTDDEKTKKANSSQFPCTQCSRSYKSKASLKNHVHTAHNAKRKQRGRPIPEYKCDQCGEVFRSERNLRGHMWKHTGIFCDICGKPFTQTGNMLRHKIRHTGVKAHKCQECSACFYTDKELRAHMLRHTGIWPHICEICGRRCRDRGVLTAHMRRHTGERPATCNVCGKSFYSFHDLNVHAVAHTSARPFVCEICGSSFQRKKALRVHKKLHSTERKHECQICGKAFVQSSYLNVHMRTHDAAALSKDILSVCCPPAGSVAPATSTRAAPLDCEIVIDDAPGWKHADM